MEGGNLAICSKNSSMKCSIAVRKVLPESLARARAYAEIAQARLGTFFNKGIYEGMKCSNLAICSMKCSKLLSIAVRKVLPESRARAPRSSRPGSAPPS
jgi:hypothetical protein